MCKEHLPPLRDWKIGHRQLASARRGRGLGRGTEGSVKLGDLPWKINAWNIKHQLNMRNHDRPSPLQAET